MRKIITGSSLFLFVVVMCGLPSLHAASPQIKSRVIVGALVFDGSGRAGVRANVRIVADHIAEVGQFVPRAGEEIIEARGLALAPGFIDIHNHSEDGLATEPSAASQVSQG